MRFFALLTWSDCSVKMMQVHGFDVRILWGSNKATVGCQRLIADTDSIGTNITVQSAQKQLRLLPPTTARTAKRRLEDNPKNHPDRYSFLPCFISMLSSKPSTLYFIWFAVAGTPQTRSCPTREGGLEAILHPLLAFTRGSESWKNLRRSSRPSTRRMMSIIRSGRRGLGRTILSSTF